MNNLEAIKSFICKPDNYNKNFHILKSSEFSPVRCSTLCLCIYMTAITYPGVLFFDLFGTQRSAVASENMKYIPHPSCLH